MGIYSNWQNDVKKDAKKTEELLETTEGRKWVKYSVYVLLGIVVLLFGSCVLQSIFTPRRMAQPLEYQSSPVVMQSPVYQNNPDPMVGVIAGMAIGHMMSNGQRYDGHNGYNDSSYRGPSRTVVVNKTIINKPVAAPPITAPIVAPVAAKVKNPGNTAAEQVRKNDALKAELKAKQAARARTPAPVNRGYNSFSKSIYTGGGKRR